MRSRTLLGPVVVVLGSTGLLLFGLSDFGDDWRPVVEPLDLSRPGSIVTSFNARPEVRYTVGVEVDRGPLADCLLGVRRSREAPPCEVEDVLNVEWVVRRGGAEVVHGTSADWPGSTWGGGSATAALLDPFVAGSEESAYEITLFVLSPSPGLVNLHPRLVVAIGSGARHADYASRGYSFLAGLVGILVALGVALRTLWRERRAS
jgi:hypothetical protein